jgi:hypothetical protein
MIFKIIWSPTGKPGLGGSKEGSMEPIKEALMQWGDAILIVMENRGMFYSPVLKHWRVKKLAGVDRKNFLYDGDNFMAAMETLLGPHVAESPFMQKAG